MGKPCLSGHAPIQPVEALHRLWTTSQRSRRQQIATQHRCPTLASQSGYHARCWSPTPGAALNALTPPPSLAVRHRTRFRFLSPVPMRLRHRNPMSEISAPMILLPQCTRRKCQEANEKMPEISILSVMILMQRCPRISLH